MPTIAPEPVDPEAKRVMDGTGEVRAARQAYLQATRKLGDLHALQGLALIEQARALEALNAARKKLNLTVEK